MATRRSNVRGRRYATNGIEEIDGYSDVLFRSVSADELADIFTTGRIVGRGNTFAGDDRDYVFFGETSVEDVMDQGEDLQRSVSTEPKYNETRARMREIDGDLRAARSERSEILRRRGLDVRDPDLWSLSKTDRRMVEELERDARKLEGAYHRVQSSWLRKVESEAKKLRVLNRKMYGATSFVIELRNVPGGVRFTAPDSYHQTAEVGFSRPTGIPSGNRRILRVWPILDGAKLPPLTPDAAARLVLAHRRSLA